MKRDKTRQNGRVWNLFDRSAFFGGVFNHLKLFFCCTKRGDQMSSLKSEKKKNTIKEFLCIAATQRLLANLIHPADAQQGALELRNTILLLLLQPSFPGKAPDFL